MTTPSAPEISRQTTLKPVTAEHIDIDADGRVVGLS